MQAIQALSKSDFIITAVHPSPLTFLLAYVESRSALICVCACMSFEGLGGNPDGVSSPHFYRIHTAMPHGSTFIILYKKPLAAHQRSRYGMQTIFLK